MALVTTTNFSILLNGAPSRTFTPSRGLIHGDPLSPFLFVLMMEGLGRAIKMESDEGRIYCIKLTSDGVANTHQQFVDDTMLQGIPTVKEARAIKNILNDFAMAIGTEVSLNKSKVFFFNTNIFIQRNITRILGFQREQLPSKYLGIPLTDKPLSKKVWEPILNKLQDNVRKWTWEEKKKWALVVWDKLCKPKSHGSLGLHDPETLSKVSGAKLWWRWIKELNAPWAKLWKQKYAKYWQEKDHIRMSGKIRGSHIWNLAWENKSIVQQHYF
eukprot:PITA_06003